MVKRVTVKIEELKERMLNVNKWRGELPKEETEDKLKMKEAEVENRKERLKKKQQKCDERRTAELENLGRTKLLLQEREKRQIPRILSPD